MKISSLRHLERANELKVWISERPKGHSGSRYRVVWIDPATKRERSKSFSRKRDAAEFRTHTENAMRSGPYRDPESGRKSFDVLAQSWMLSRRNIRESTRNRDERDLRVWVLPKWGMREIGSISREEIITWVSQLEAGEAPHEYASRVSEKAANGLSPRSIRALHIILSAVLSYGVSIKALGINEARNIELPRASTPPRSYLGFEEVEVLAKLVSGASGRDEDETLVRFLAYSGVRIGEALSLQVGDVTLKTRRVSINRTWTDSNGAIKLGPPKSGKARKVPIHGFLVADLETLVSGRDNGDWLFTAPRGGHHTPNNWRARVWTKAIAGTEFQSMGLSPHGLRHTAASMAIASLADVKVVQEMLGHSSAVETLDTYADLWPDRLDEVIDKVTEARSRKLGRLAGPKDTIINGGVALPAG